MSDTTKISLKLLQRVAEFLEGLPEEHLVDLSEGRARITFIPWGGTEPAKPRTGRATAHQPDMSEARAELDRSATREQGQTYLDGFKVPELRALASLLGLGGLGKAVKADIIAKIVERTVGNRLNSEAIRQL